MAPRLRAMIGGLCLVACAHAPPRQRPVATPPPAYAALVERPPFIDDRPLVSEAGRLFFARAYETQVQMLWVRKVGDETYLELANEVAGSGRFRVTSENAGLITATHDGDRLEARLNADGSFAGELKRSWGEITTYVPNRYLPVTDELAAPVGFVGFLRSGARYRMILSARGNAVSGFARFPDTRVDLEVRGTLDRARRRLILEELDSNGKVRARLDLALLWLPAGPEQPVFPLLDGGRTEREAGAPLRLDGDLNDPYPRRVVLKSGAALAAQESYDDDCGVVADMVFPVPEGVDASVAKKIDISLRKWMQRGYERFAKVRPDDPLQPIDRPASFAPGTRNTADDCTSKQARHRVSHEDTYSALPLLDDWIAIDITHYTNLTGITDAGSVRHDCVIVDMATGSVAEPNTYFTEDARARFRASVQERADRERRDEIKRLVAAGYSDADAAGEVDHRRRGVDMNQRPLCIGASDVRLKAPNSVFGTEVDVVWTRKELAAFLPDGPLRKHVEP